MKSAAKIEAYADSLFGELEAERHAHRKDNEYLLGEVEKLRDVLKRIEHWPFDVGHTPERDLREIKEAAHDALA